ncbi:hypothetical protein ACF1A5_07780 [Streptomyces sp. NPDC014864]|uniref:hypothetical protein n=1 Tax=Streptomyces sp. NPDC014864 TaxID=3364924 RepID=UPI0036FBC513
MAVKRTEYFNFDTGSARSGGTVRSESLMDSEDYYRRLDDARGATLHTWGVAGGLGVSATPGGSGVTVQPGAALDAAGRISVLEPGGFAVVDPAVDPDQPLNIPTVVVGADGLQLATTGVPAGTHVLTLTWREVLGETRLIRLHAPWLRLLPSDGFQDAGGQVVLAEVTVDAGGAVTGVAAGPRRSVGIPAGRVELRSPQVTTGSGTTVGQAPAAELRARPDGGLDLTVFAPDGTSRPALSANGSDGGIGIGTSAPSAPLEIDTGTAGGHGLRITSATGGSGIELVRDDDGPAYGMFPGDDGAWHLRDEDSATDLFVVDAEGTALLAELQVGGNLVVGSSLGVGSDLEVAEHVSVALTDSPAASLHVNGTGVHSGGDAGGFSFADRAVGGFVETPANGERWVWYAFEGSARLWSGADLITIGHGEGNALDVQKRMRVRGGGDRSAGTWLHQTDQEIDEDRAFVGMENNSSVGLWGNTGAGWGLVMDTGSGRVSCRGGLTVSGETVFDTHFGRRDAQAALHLFGSVVQDRGNGILNLQSGGNVIAMSGSEDLVGIGTITPQFKLDVNGSVRVLGALEKAGGGFKIDHPLDPANRYLSHSFVESPDMTNLYGGVVETDDEGEATVVLPDWFEALNRDIRYQLTPVGALAQVAVTGEVKGNRFTLRADQPGIKVSWQVTGVRQDAWAEAHRIPVEEDKAHTDRAYYLHPEEHGQPEDSGLLKHREGMSDEPSADAGDAGPDAGTPR